MNQQNSNAIGLGRRGFLASLPGAAISLRQAVAAPAKPLNVALILADDLGWADIEPYGADLHQTPNLTRLARQSVRFTRAHSASPVCSPTRASIQTGRHPARLHMTIWREGARRPVPNRRLIPPVVEENLPHSESTLAEVLHENGYFTAHAGKWHLGNSEHYPEAHGFDVNVGGTAWGAPQSFFWPYRGTRYFGGEYRYVPGLHGGQAGEYLTDRLTSEALKLMESAKGRPFFLNLCYHNVHTPIEGKPELVERYKRAVKPGMHHRNPDYAAMVHSLDENVGRVLDRLEQMGAADNTLVIFTSDNGGFISEWQGQAVTSNHPLRSGKGSLYEGGTRVPLLIRLPGVAKAGAVCDEPVCSTDFYKTILEAAGVRVPAGAGEDGLSLLPLLRDPKASLARSELFFHYPHYYPTTTPVSAVLSRDWKLLEYLEDGRKELYHLAEDPGETKNLAAAMPDQAARLKQALDEWRKQVDAQMPSPNPDFTEVK